VPPRIVLLVDNHHGPDRRAAWVSSAIRAAGATVRVVAWDRRVTPGSDPPPPAGEDVVRIHVPAQWGAGRGTVAAVGRFSALALRRRRELLAGADAVIAGDIYLLPLGRALAAAARVPLIYEAREDWAALEAARFPAGLRRAVTRAETALARGAAAVVVPGETRAARWRAVGVDPVVLRNVGNTAPRPAPTRWDVATAGLMAEQRRPDLFLALARRRPDLRFVVTGGGRLEREVRRGAEQSPNVDYLGWVDDVDAVLAASSVIVYGEDAATPYSALACPNTLYQAIRLRRPLVFYCGGEPAEAAARFKIGVRCPPEVEALSAAVDDARAGDGWEFDAAWQTFGVGAERAFQERLREVLNGGAARR
jgi:glycosyltransferase involved in cell wall biosynthesis